MNSRFNLGLRPATAQETFQAQDAIDGNASAHPDTFALETLLVPAVASHSLLTALLSVPRVKFSPLCFQSLAHSFSLLAKGRHTISLLFNHLHILCNSTGGKAHSHQTTAVSPPRLGRRRVRGSPQRRPGKRTGSGRCSLFAMSLFRHIVTSSLHREKPYPAAYHLKAKRYRTEEEVYTSSCREADHATHF
jgi:hypothetical protein